uniref:Lactadherin-like n=1 Tax=Phallusia mammillata TaxID=59560 RepID=A0A6F9DL73_9ASCI|nr:lactadherin-like [Phallusia mammillata]
MYIFKTLLFVFPVLTLSAGSESCPIVQSCKRLETMKEQLKKFSEVNLAANRDSLCKLGLQMGLIPDSAFFASSVFSDILPTEPKHARLDYLEGAWVPEISQVGEWIEVTLEELTTITGIITQGRYTKGQWVKRFNVEYLNKIGGSWIGIRDASSNLQFLGNNDENTKALNMFEGPVEAIAIRVVALTWNEKIALRHEYLTC